MSEETKAKISAARASLGIKLSLETRAKLSAATAARASPHGVSVKVNIVTGDTEELSTMTGAARYLGVIRTTIKNIIRSGKIFRDSYSIELKDL